MNISQVHRCILWILWVILQVCFSDLYSSVSKWRLRDEWANNISGNFAKFSPNCTVFFMLCCTLDLLFMNKCIFLVQQQRKNESG
jgi:hypothetical protein